MQEDPCPEKAEQDFQFFWFLPSITGGATEAEAEAKAHSQLTSDPNISRIEGTGNREEAKVAVGTSGDVHPGAQDSRLSTLQEREPAALPWAKTNPLTKAPFRETKSQVPGTGSATQCTFD